MSSTRCKVTLVEDDPFVLDVLTRAARSWDFDCQSAQSAEEAWDLLQNDPTPVVVTDLRMPGKGGTWLVGEVRRRWPSTSVIVVTAGEEDESLARCLEAGAQRYFLKPIQLDEFHHALWTAHAEHQNDQNHRRLQKSLARQTRQRNRLYHSALASLVRTLEAHDPYTLGHSLRVRENALRLAQRLHLPPRMIRQVGLAARLHDFGKIGIAEGILHKSTPLTDEERNSVREHPILGERILRPIVRNRQVLAGIRHHHERFDGTGYPDNLAGSSIPLIARIIALPDCYDAITSCRSYNCALASTDALEVICQGAGKHFDPELTKVFVEMIRDEL